MAWHCLKPGTGTAKALMSRTPKNTLPRMQGHHQVSVATRTAWSRPEGLSFLDDDSYILHVLPLMPPVKEIENTMQSKQTIQSLGHNWLKWVGTLKISEISLRQRTSYFLGPVKVDKSFLFPDCGAHHLQPMSNIFSRLISWTLLANINNMFPFGILSLKSR